MSRARPQSAPQQRANACRHDCPAFRFSPCALHNKEHRCKPAPEAGGSKAGPFFYKGGSLGEERGDMRYIGSGFGLIAAAVIATPLHAADGPVVVHDVSLAMAKAAAEATLAECRAKGYRTAVTGVDRAGNVIVAMR